MLKVECFFPRNKFMMITKSTDACTCDFISQSNSRSCVCKSLLTPSFHFHVNLLFTCLSKNPFVSGTLLFSLLFSHSITNAFARQTCQCPFRLMNPGQLPCQTKVTIPMKSHPSPPVPLTIRTNLVLLFTTHTPCKWPVIFFKRTRAYMMYWIVASHIHQSRLH